MTITGILPPSQAPAQIATPSPSFATRAQVNVGSRDERLLQRVELGGRQAGHEVEARLGRPSTTTRASSCTVFFAQSSRRPTTDGFRIVCPSVSST